MMDTIEARLLSLGMKPIKGENRPLTDDEIVQIEKLKGSELPHDYKVFVSRYGCVYFPGKTLGIRPLSSPHPTTLTPAGLLEISVIFGGGTSHYRVIQTMQLLNLRMPSSMIPIADDDGANVFCLVVASDTIGKAGEIYFWSSSHDLDREDFELQGLPVPDDYLWKNVALVARSFTDFVSRLEEIKV